MVNDTCLDIDECLENPCDVTVVSCFVISNICNSPFEFEPFQLQLRIVSDVMVDLFVAQYRWKYRHQLTARLCRKKLQHLSDTRTQLTHKNQNKIAQFLF